MLSTSCPKPPLSRSRRKPAGIKRSPVKRINRKRKASEFARCYHSKERVAFVKSLPCILKPNWYGCRGPSDNAHVGLKGKGAGRKADYDQIAPMCRGHHHSLHGLGRDDFQDMYEISLEKAACETELAWREFSASEQGKP